MEIGLPVYSANFTRQIHRDFGRKFRDYFWIIRHYEIFFAIFLGQVLFLGALPLQRVDLTRHGIIETTGLIDRISETFL